MRIGIDAGHQAHGNSATEPIGPGATQRKAKVSSGTSGRVTGVPEYEVTLNVALLLERKLLDLGAEVVMVRRTHQVDIPNSQRAIMMNEAGVSLCIRIHCNGSENTNVKGALMFIPSGSWTVDIAADSKRAGEIILSSFLRATGASNAGIQGVSDLTGFNWSTVPVCLIEMGFMTNAEEDELLVSPAYQEKCAQGLADGVVAWWNAP